MNCGGCLMKMKPQHSKQLNLSDVRTSIKIITLFYKLESSFSKFVVTWYKSFGQLHSVKNFWLLLVLLKVCGFSSKSFQKLLLDTCNTWCLSACCSPCMYGQMGAYKKKRVHIIMSELHSEKKRAAALTRDISLVNSFHVILFVHKNS